MQIEGIRRIGSRRSSLVTGSILDIFTLQGFEECCWINKRCKVVDKRNFLSFFWGRLLFFKLVFGFDMQYFQSLSGVISDVGLQ